MESNQQSLPRPTGEPWNTNQSGAFSKTVQSHMYQSLHLQDSNSLIQNRPYDAEYRQGFPKLYSFDTSAPGRSRLSLDGKNKYSFRNNDNSRIIEQNNLVIQENNFLKGEINRLNGLIEKQRRNSVGRQELDRLNAILVQRDAEIRTLNERIFSFQQQQQQQPKPTQSNEWQIRFTQSQSIINQQNMRISQLTQQLSQQQQPTQASTRIAQLTQQYETQITQLTTTITQLTTTINQYKQQVSQLSIQLSESQATIQNLERQQNFKREDPQVFELRHEVTSLTSRVEQYEVQISQYKKTVAQYESQITTLQQVNWRLEERVQQQQEGGVRGEVVAVDDDSRILEEGKLNLRIIILLEEINRLRQRENDLVVKAEELHAYLLKAENYIEEIQSELEKNNLKENVPAHIVERVTTLEQQNSRYTLLIQELQSRLSVTQTGGVPEEEYLSGLGERDLRIIILLEEINRLNQKIVEVREYLVNAEDYIEQLQKALQGREPIIPEEIEKQITYLSEENHRLNSLIENYINEIKHLKFTFEAPNLPKIEYLVPPEVETKLGLLAQENDRLTRLNTELQARPVGVETKVEYRVPADVQNRIATLTQQNSRLNNLIIQLQSQVNSTTVIQSQPVNDFGNFEEEYAKARLRIIILLEEINRLNYSFGQVTQHLVNAENFIFELETRISQQTTITETIVQTQQVEVVPAWIEGELAKMSLQKIILLEEINRLNYSVNQIHSHLISAEEYIQQCEVRFEELSQQQTSSSVEFRIPVEVENQLAFFAQQNDRLNKLVLEIQNRPARVETRVQQKVEFKIPAEFETRISLLANENQRLERELSEKSQNTQDESLVLEYGKLQFRSIILLEEINRLNFVLNEVRGFLSNAETYIFEIEGRQQQAAVPAEVEEEIMNLRQQNQKLHAEINRLSIFYDQQIFEYKTEIANINIQLSTLRTETITYKSRINELESQSTSGSLSTQLQQELESKWAAEHLRAIILLEEVNRLNQKCADIDRERVEVIGHLVSAQNYLQELEGKYAQLQSASAKQSSMTINTAFEGSNSAIQQLNGQLAELETVRRIEVAARDLRIIFLLEQINRLNYRERELIAALEQGQGSSSTSEEIFALKRDNEQCQMELQEVLLHLRQAEQYIGQLLRESEGLVAERDHLVDELNRRG